MRIKRFIAKDMRSALKQVREDQGPDAVILSNRRVAEGIEIVAALDYDAQIVQQALPGVVRQAAAEAATRTPEPAPAAEAASVPQSQANPRAGRLEQMMAALRPRNHGENKAAKAATPAAPASEPSFAEILAAQAAPAQPRIATAAIRTGTSASALVQHKQADEDRAQFSEQARTLAAQAQPTVERPAPAPTFADIQPLPAAPTAAPAATADGVSVAAMVPAAADRDTRIADTRAETPRLALVAESRQDPAIAAMREELTQMRTLMERQLQELAQERMRVSPSRSAVYQALQDFGVDMVQAQHVATRIDPTLDRDVACDRMMSEFARLITLPREDVLGDNGIYAVVGPAESCRTRTLARMVERQVAERGCRNIALVAFDNRPAARERLYAHGRRLGVLVREAESLAQLDAVLRELADYPLVLIDTPADVVRHAEVRARFATLAGDSGMKLLLALPASADAQALEDSVTRHAGLPIAAVALTRSEDAPRLGTALSVVVKHSLPLACIDRLDDNDALPALDRTRLVLVLKAAHRTATTLQDDEAHVHF